MREAATLEMRGATALITFNRPEQKNALDIDMRETLAKHVVTVRDDPAVKAVVLTGAGDAFCAGGDLKSLSSEKRPVTASRNRIRRLHIWFQELVNLEKPVVAAVHGPAFGAGFNLALACDFILCSPQARFSAVFERIGLVPDLGGFFLLPRILGLQRAKELIFSTRVLEPEEARQLGVVYAIHPAPQLLDAALELAGRFHNASTDAIGMAKNVLNQAFHLDQRALAEMESYAQALAVETSYHQEAVARFKRKEPPLFQWGKKGGK